MTDYIRPPKAHGFLGKDHDVTSNKMPEEPKISEKILDAAQPVDYLQVKNIKEKDTARSEKATKGDLQLPSVEDQEAMETIKKMPGVRAETVRIEGNLILATKTDGSPLTHVKTDRAKKFRAYLATALKEPRKPSASPAILAMSMRAALVEFSGDDDFVDGKKIV